MDAEDDAAILSYAEAMARDHRIELDDGVRQEVLEAARNGAFVEDVLEEYADGLSFNLASGFASAAQDQRFSIHEDDNATEAATQPREDADIREGGETVPTGEGRVDADGRRSGDPAQEVRGEQSEAPASEGPDRVELTHQLTVWAIALSTNLPCLLALTHPLELRSVA